MRSVLCAVGILLLVGGCNRQPAEPGAADLSRAESMRPSDKQLAERYERSCMTCHAQRGSGAPLTGFAADWQPRLKKGDAQLLQHARDGFNGMPAKGLCNDCSDDDLSRLTKFMSGGAV